MSYICLRWSIQYMKFWVFTFFSLFPRDSWKALQRSQIVHVRLSEYPEGPIYEFKVLIGEQKHFKVAPCIKRYEGRDVTRTLGQTHILNFVKTSLHIIVGQGCCNSTPQLTCAPFPFWALCNVPPNALSCPLHASCTQCAQYTCQNNTHSEGKQKPSVEAYKSRKYSNSTTG